MEKLQETVLRSILVVSAAFFLATHTYIIKHGKIRIKTRLNFKFIECLKFFNLERIKKCQTNTSSRVPNAGKKKED